MSKHEDEVCKKIQQRAGVGKKKYGTTMERTDLSVHEWLVHLQEELMDAAVYVERLMEEFKDIELTMKYGRDFAQMMRDLNG
ncbi:MAG: hypothetical protein CL605_02175 [Altibacter sp.]|uniref:hypothetical protein n=1 Tax=Altibacter sp. TaxID=2024823 RepID=UPI000C8CCED8|nr:hypothetical protein [Altibacter sp.]MAP53689.1 hypothetical protein [Altibacter sp.]